MQTQIDNEAYIIDETTTHTIVEFQGETTQWFHSYRSSYDSDKQFLNFVKEVMLEQMETAEDEQHAISNGSYNPSLNF